MVNAKGRSCARAGCLLLVLMAYAEFLCADGIGVLKPQGNRRVVLAVRLLSQGHTKEADALFAQVTENQFGYLDATLGRAQISITGGQLDQADRRVSEVLVRQPSLPEGHNMKGLILLLRKDPGQAKQEFRRAIQLRPRYVTPRLYLAVLARVNGDLDGALDEYRGLIGVAPHHPSGYLGCAEVLMLQGHRDESFKVLAAWKTADPRTSAPYQVMANIFLAEGKAHEAFEQVQAALVKEPHNSITLTILGTAYADVGDTRSSATQYEAALAADRTNANAAVRLGSLEAAVGQNGKAMAHFRQALAVEPENTLACNNIAWLLATEGKNLDEAMQLAQVAVKRDPGYAAAYDTLGWVKYRRGEYASAVATLRRAKMLAPSSPEVAGHLGLAYAKVGDRRDAASELSRALASTTVLTGREELERVAAEVSR